MNKVETLRKEISETKKLIDSGECKDFKEFLIVLLWFGKESIVENPEGDNMLCRDAIERYYMEEIQKLYPGTTVDDVFEFLEGDERVRVDTSEWGNYYSLI